MSQYRRIFIPGGTYFFTVVTHDRAPRFTTPERVESLRAAFRQVMGARPFQIDAIVVLPDHLHCIWRLPEGDADYSGRWREIKKMVSRAIDVRANRRHERPIWQRRFWEHSIRDEKDWRKHLDYIHYNPVKHSLVVQPGDWPWSSFNRTVSWGWYEADWGQTDPIGIVDMDVE